MAHSIRSRHASAARRATGTARCGLPGDDVEELPAAHVDDLGRPRLGAEPSDPGEQVSSSPSAVTSPIRSGWSIELLPMTTTASITVCQPQPRSRPHRTPHVRCGRPATSPTRRPVVNAHRACAISALSSHQQRPHVAQRQRCLRHTSRPADRTPADPRARPRGSRDGAPTATAHAGRSARVSITTRSHLGHSPTPITLTSGRPTSSAHMRVASVSKQGLLETR